MPRPGVLLAAAVLLIMSLSTACSRSGLPPFPETRRDAVAEEFHGTVIEDPYRWLENPDAPEVQAWVAEQNRRTDAYFDALAERAWFRQRLETIWNYERLSTPKVEAGYYYYVRNSGLQNQAPLYRRRATGGPEELVLDPNVLDAQGTTALTNWSVSPCGRYLAYGLSVKGSDWQQAFVLDLGTGQRTADELRWIKFTGLEWLPDSSGFFYSRFPEPEASASGTLSSSNKMRRTYFHRLHTPQESDVLVFEYPQDPEVFAGVSVSDDGSLLVLNIGKGTGDADGLRVAPLVPGRLPGPADFAEVLPFGTDADYQFVNNLGRTLFIRTNESAPRFRLIAVDLDRPEPSAWRDVIPQSADILAGVRFVQGHFLAIWMRDAASVVSRHDVQGRFLNEIALPGIGTASGFEADSDDAEVFFTFQSYTTPPSVFRYRVAEDRLEPYWAAKVPFDPAAFEVTREFATSRDGTRVPMFVVARRGLPRDGRNPTLLYGYGGFNVSMQPSFASSIVPWLERGGVYAVAVLRGGGEYGTEWHRAGRLEKKQNVFDDFAAAGDRLVELGITRPERLGIEGRSNGGLLTGASVVQRPRAFGAAIVAVGVLDMLRFHRFTIGYAWVPEYGSAEDPAQFPFLYAYSPLHNVKPARYPATLIYTADHDDRVVPAHSYKFAAALQPAQRGDKPILLRVDTKSGHGMGKPIGRLIDEQAERWGFLARELGMEITP